MNKRLITFYGGLAAAIFSLGIVKDVVTYDANKDPKVLYQKVVEESDLNHDGNVTENEWLTVYRFLDKPYDARHPSSLSIDDMRKYLQLN